MIACPGCGANLRFDIQSQKMKCGYCGEAFDPARFAGITEDAESSRTFDAYVFHCSGCGAELVTADETDATGHCPYCGGDAILFDRLKQVKMPSGIIPFQVTKEGCRKAYLQAASRAIFTSARYKKPELLDSFRGIYMPFWSYTVEHKGKASVDARGKSYDEGQYVCTPEYQIQGDLDMSYNGYAHDASKAFDDQISECIIPFDLKKEKPFSPGYLSGFYADAADVPAESFEEQAIEACQMRTAEKLLENANLKETATIKEMRTSGASHVEIPTEIKDRELVYYPVWFMSYRQKDRITYAAVNGQNGKVVADFPVSPLRFLLAAFLAAGLLFVVLNTLFTIKPGWALATTTVLMALGILLSGRSVSPDQKKSSVGSRILRVLGILYVFGMLLGVQSFLDSGNTAGAWIVIIMLLFTISPAVLILYFDFQTGRRKKVDPSDRSAPFQLSNAMTYAGLVLVILAAVILGMQPVYNLCYYVPAFLEAGLLFAVYVLRFHHHLSLAMRRPPQFNKGGGDDDA